MHESLASTVIRDGDRLVSRLAPVGAPMSIGALLRANTARLGRHPVVLEKRRGRFQPMGWTAFCGKVVALMEFLRGEGIGPGDRVAIVSRNRSEMLVTEFAVMCLGAIYVPIFAGYSGEQTEGLLRHCGASALVVSGPRQLRKILVPPDVRLVLTCEPIDRGLRAALLERHTPEPVLFETALSEARDEGTSAMPPRFERILDEAAGADPHRPCLMMYTSGTAGEQKGVLLTHDNILSQQRALARIWNVDDRDRLLCYLPWHHSFGGIFEKYTGLYNGAPLAIDESYGKDFPLLLANWKTVRPTVYFSVPLIHQQLVDHVRVHPQDEDVIYHDGLKFVFTAAAPLPSSLSDYYAAKKIPVVEGWGLTETSPCCTVTDGNERRSLPGVVGYPIPGVQLRLAEDGEILVRGPNVMPGYFENPEATARAFPGDGWFHTGDLGAFEGVSLRLLTRKDRVFKMLNAEKIVPTIMENRLAGENKYIRHALVVGDGQGFLAALLFPNYSLIEEEFGEDRERAERAVRESYQRSIRRLNEENPVKYEHIQAYAIVDRELTVEDGELTPSMKVRVQNVVRSSREFIEAIYDPLKDCDCTFLRKVMRLAPDERACPLGKDVNLDRCHECGSSIFEGRSEPRGI